MINDAWGFSPSEIFWMNNNYYYWIRLTMIWRIMQIGEGVISWGKITTLRDIPISDDMKGESNFNYTRDQGMCYLPLSITPAKFFIFPQMIWKGIQQFYIIHSKYFQVLWNILTSIDVKFLSSFVCSSGANSGYEGMSVSLADIP